MIVQIEIKAINKYYLSPCNLFGYHQIMEAFGIITFNHIRHLVVLLISLTVIYSICFSAVMRYIYIYILFSKIDGQNPTGPDYFRIKQNNMTFII